MPLAAIVFLKPIAESCAHCHSSTVCSMPTSVGPMASLPKPPPPGLEEADTSPSPANDADAVDVMPLASVTSSVSVSSLLSASRASRLYSTCGSPLAPITDDEEDHLYVYGATPPLTSASPETTPSRMVALKPNSGDEPGTAGTWRFSCVPV